MANLDGMSSVEFSVSQELLAEYFELTKQRMKSHVNKHIFDSLVSLMSSPRGVLVRPVLFCLENWLCFSRIRLDLMDHKETLFTEWISLPSSLKSRSFGNKAGRELAT